MTDNTRNITDNITADNLEAVKPETVPEDQETNINTPGKPKTITAINANGIQYNRSNLDIIRTESQAKEKGRKGGIKSGEVRREQAKARRTAQDILKAITEYKMTDDQIQTVIGDEGRAILGDDKTTYAVMLCRMILQGMDGDTKAAQFVRDTIGDTLPTQTQVQAEIITADDVQLIENARKALTG